MKELEGKLFRFKNTNFTGYLYHVEEQTGKSYFIWNVPNWQHEVSNEVFNDYLKKDEIYEIQSL